MRVKFSYFTFILLLVICRILSFLATWIPFSFSTALYDIQSCSRVSPTASNPVKFFILFRAKFKITKFFSPFKFAILSIAFVHRFNFLQFTSTNNLKNICQKVAIWCGGGRWRYWVLTRYPFCHKVASENLNQ